jgi:glutamyl-tRNA reductase
MTVLVVGVSHKTAPVELREKLAFAPEQLPQALAQLTAAPAIEEAVILSTCNRTEVYVEAQAAPEGFAAVRAFICDYHGLAPDEASTLANHIYTRQSSNAVAHLFKVVSSLDSLVLGEAQILGQVRQAYLTASEAGTCGDVFNHLFKQAIEVGRKVRSSTAIGANSVSVSTAAVNLVGRVFDGVADLCIILVGTGQMGQLTARYLAEKGAGHILVANRTFEGAQALAAEIGGKAIPFEELGSYLRTADMLISSTAAPDYVVGRDLVAGAMRHHRGRPLLLVDIALPRDIDPACADLHDVYLSDLDDLGGIIDDNLKEREGEAVKAEELVDQAVSEFQSWKQQSAVVPTIKQMFIKAEAVAGRERDRAVKALTAQRGAELSAEELKVLDAMANSIASKILHGPTARLRKQAGNPEGLRYTESARFLFGLDTNPSGKAHPCIQHPQQTCGVAQGQLCIAAPGTGCGQRQGEQGVK